VNNQPEFRHGTPGKKVTETMPIHRKIIIIAGLGMLSVMTIVVLSLVNVMSAFSSIIGEVERSTQAVQQIEDVAREIANLSNSLHRYVTAGDAESRGAYETSLAAVRGRFGDFEKMDLGEQGRQLDASLRSDAARFEEKAGRIFALKDLAGRNRVLAHNIVIETDGLLEWMNRDIEKYSKEAHALQIRRIADNVYFQKKQVVLLFVVFLILSGVFLLAFGIYVHRTIAVPLKDLWKGATEVSQGNLDYRMQLDGTGDIAQLAARFNEMALKLKRSYAELEKKLFERTNELAAIDAVALTLSQAANMKEMLTRSLSKILDSLVGLEPRGGVFLCEAGGETLRLVAHRGLPPEFTQQEETINMGECLCGQVAQAGEILYSEKGCENLNHTRGGLGQGHSHIIIPIKSRGIVLGVIFLYPQKVFTLKPSDLQMLETIGNQLGMAVENLRFYAEVKESSEKFWDLFENSRDILFTMDPAGTLTAVNKAAEIFSGYSKTDLIGKSVLDFLTPEASATAKRMLGGHGVTARQVIEFEVIKRDGSRAFIELSARKLMRRQTASGYQVSARDMTEQKLLREKLLRAERLGAIGEIVITVRHEINNPLTTVIGNIELLIERYGGKDRDLSARLETILSNALRIAEIVKQLQAIKRDKAIEYVNGVTMTDLKQE
jgi:PAS domain S-box-containing protein